MASPPILNFETLLAPIAGANPAGEPVPLEVRRKLDDARKEVNPKSFAPDDPRRPAQPQFADWPGIEQLTQDTLSQTSKDLLVAARLTEALVKVHGFGGLRDGLRLIRRLTHECWDRIYPVIPVIQDGDPEAQAAADEERASALEARAGPFNWLDDDRRGSLFPNTLRALPLTQGGDGQNYGWQQWRDAQDARGSVTAEAFDRAVAATPREYCQAVVEDIAESASELNALTESLSSKMGETAPGLAQVRKALLDCQELARLILQRKGPAPVSTPASAAVSADSAASAQPPAAPAAPRPLTRDDVLNRLADASALLLQMEPQSLIAHMIQRAVKLARLPLPDLMRVLIREPGVLGQLDRDLDLGLEKAAQGGKGK
jgi:type VI secretion system protein ImpA